MPFEELIAKSRSWRKGEGVGLQAEKKKLRLRGARLALV